MFFTSDTELDRLVSPFKSFPSWDQYLNSAIVAKKSFQFQNFFCNFRPFMILIYEVDFPFPINDDIWIFVILIRLIVSPFYSCKFWTCSYPWEVFKAHPLTFSPFIHNFPFPSHAFCKVTKFALVRERQSFILRIFVLFPSNCILLSPFINFRWSLRCKFWDFICLSWKRYVNFAWSWSNIF